MEQNYPIDPMQLAQLTLALTGRVGATKILKVPSLSAAIAAGAAVAASAPTLTFQRPGVVLAMYGQEVTGTAAKFATTEVGVQINGSEELISDGVAGATVSMLLLFGLTMNSFALNRRVQAGENWNVRYVNRDAGAAATPQVAFAFIADA